MTTKQRAYLRSLAMTMDPVANIGKGSVTDENIDAIKEALEARELIKIAVLKNCLDDPKTVAQAVAEHTHAELVQVIGRRFVLFKEAYDPKNRHIKI